MLNLIIFGAPGSGKGTQSEVLIEKYGFDHISTGDLLRAEIKAESELGRLLRAIWMLANWYPIASSST